MILLNLFLKSSRVLGNISNELLLLLMSIYGS